MADQKTTLRLEDIPEMNFGKFMIDEMKKYGDRVALIDGATDARYTFADVIDRTERLAAGLQSIGVQKRDVVGIISPNNLEYHVSFFAVNLVTAVFQTVNPLFPPADIKKVMEECNTKFVITTQELLPKVKEADVDLNKTKVIVFGEAEGCLSFESLLDPKYGSYTTPTCDPKTTVSTLLSSSGTTGFPKAVKLSHFSLVANITQLNHNATSQVGECYIIFIPMFHAYGLYMLASTALASGAFLVVMARFTPDDFMGLIQKHKPKLIHTVPPIMVMFAKHPKVAEYDLSSVKIIACGAAPLSEDIEKQVIERLGVEHILQGYGMTEVGVTHFNRPEFNRHNAVGKLVPLAELKISDTETQEALGPNQNGEIWVRGPQVTMGYVNRESETKEMFLEDGWVRTGDVGYEDENGFLYIVDRLKELIKYKGYQVAPAALEDILLRHQSVADVGVIGVQDEAAGELPKAFVVKKAGSEVTAKELIEHVTGLVAPHMKLRGGVEFVTEIPRSASGKILRRALRERQNAQ